MRTITTLLLAAVIIAPAQTSDETDAIAVVQKVFNGIEKHDGDLIRSVMLPEARIYSVRESGDSASSSIDTMATQIASSKTPLLERFTSPPRVLVRGRIDQVWGEYEFLQNGK